MPTLKWISDDDVRVVKTLSEPGLAFKVIVSELPSKALSRVAPGRTRVTGVFCCTVITPGMDPTREGLMKACSFFSVFGN